MKVAPIFISREAMLKKVAKRKSERLFKYTETNLTSEMGEKVSSLVDSLSRYGANKNIIYGFENSGKSNLVINAFLAQWKNVYWPTKGSSVMQVVVNPNDNLHEISTKVKSATSKALKI